LTPYIRRIALKLLARDLLRVFGLDGDNDLALPLEDLYPLDAGVPDKVVILQEIRFLLL
jgi:hypothetical protein